MLWRNVSALVSLLRCVASLRCIHGRLNQWCLRHRISFSFVRLKRNRCALGAGTPSNHCCIIRFSHVTSVCRSKVWVSHNYFPAPLPEGRKIGSCTDRREWHLQFQYFRWKECKNAKREMAIQANAMKPVFSSFSGHEIPHLPVCITWLLSHLWVSPCQNVCNSVCIKVILTTHSE